ncbi:MAG: YggT family protein [Clostridiales Family XIII bacterium]|jgi:uncharacterized protein YggT (Ycf19 family)|nr:YggT family protein [Clostridiales Family XIII bacterium]
MIDFIIDIVISILIWILIAQALLSWFVNPYGRGGYGVVASIYRWLSSITYPLTLPARAILAKVSTGPMDFSLLLTVLFLYILRRVLILLL